VNELMAFVFWLFLKPNRSDNRRVLAFGVEGKERVRVSFWRGFVIIFLF
jgi:hypothetical protein